MSSPAPTPAPHTPVIYLLAGGMANFSASCAKLLMKAGYDPAAFGSHAYVQAQTQRAQQRVAYYKQLKSDGSPTADEFRPPESDFRAAECEPIPLATDPNRPLGDMPAYAALGPSTVPGTEASNALRAAANGASPSSVAQASIDARAGEKPNLARNKGIPPRSKAELAKEDALRANIDEAIGGQARAGGNQGPPPTRAKGKSTKKIQGKSAGECVDNFVKQGLADLESNKSNSASANAAAAAGGTGGGGSTADGGHKEVTLKGVSPEERALAAAPGNSKEQIKARQKVAKRFYKQQANMSASRARSHMRGIDFNRPITVGPPHKCPKKLNQWQSPGGKQGGYYADSSATPSQLGIHHSGGADPTTGRPIPKVSKPYDVNEDAPHMTTTAAKINDDWSVKDQKHATSGGAEQHYIPNTENATPSSP